MDILRTPDERFADLPGYPFGPHYVDDLPGYPGIRVHYLDEGQGDEESRHETGDQRPTFLCLHGNPTWSYLYRKMIPVFRASGARVVVPDLIGFGKSDKPTDEAFHTFTTHRNMLLAFVERLDLANITLVVQDWGGILGLTLPMEAPHRYKRLIVMNTALTTGSALSPGFLDWRDYSNRSPDWPISKLFARGNPHLSAEECAAYDAPFPDARYKAAIRRFPNIVPAAPDDDGAAASRRALAWWRSEWSGPSFMAIGMQDPVLGPDAMRALHANIRGCPAPMEVEEGGHFVQEHGERIARAALIALNDSGR